MNAMMRRKHSRIIINIIIIITLMAFTSCYSPRIYPDYSLELNKIQNINRNNVAIGIDVLSDKDRLEKYFGVDLLNEYADQGYAILPIYFSIENNGDRPVTLLNDSVSFISQDSTELMKAYDGQVASRPCYSKVAERESLGKIPNWSIPLLILLLPPIGFTYVLGKLFIPAPANHTDRSVASSIHSKSLRDRSLYKNQKNNGFLYFLIPSADMDKLRSSTAMRLYIKDIDTDEKIEFRFSINMSNIINRLAE